jgi:hypothetical protein
MALTPRKVLLAGAVVATLLCRGRAAAAEARGRGFALELGFGANGVTDDDYIDGAPFDVDLDPLVGLSVAGMYRIIPYVSVGLVVQYAFIYASADNLDDEYSDFLGIIPEVRGHYAFGRFEPWLGFGIGYAMTHTQLRAEEGGLDGSGALFLHGAGFALSTGVHIWLTDSFSLSPFVRMIFGAWPTACYTTDGDVAAWMSFFGQDDEDCDDVEDIYADEPEDFPHLWSVGVLAANAF